MSLKQFHIIFIILSILCTLGFAAWALMASSDLVGAWGRLGGVLSGAIGLGLIGYGVWFIQKSKAIIT